MNATGGQTDSSKCHCEHLDRVMVQVVNLEASRANLQLRVAVLEDSNTFERVQDSLNKGMLSHFTFRDHEVACRMQYHIVKEWVENYEKSKAANAA